jgi:hypothetical protein
VRRQPQPPACVSGLVVALACSVPLSDHSLKVVWFRRFCLIIIRSGSLSLGGCLVPAFLFDHPVPGAHKSAGIPPLHPCSVRASPSHASPHALAFTRMPKSNGPASSDATAACVQQKCCRSVARGGCILFPLGAYCSHLLVRLIGWRGSISRTNTATQRNAHEGCAQSCA